MSHSSDSEFEALIHEVDTQPMPVAESDDAKDLRAHLEPAHATETGELPVHSRG